MAQPRTYYPRRHPTASQPGSVDLRVSGQEAQGQDAARRRTERPRSQAASGGGDSEALRAYVAEQVDAMAGLREELEERMHGVVGAQVPLPLPSHAAYHARPWAWVLQALLCAAHKR